MTSSKANSHLATVLRTHPSERFKMLKLTQGRGRLSLQSKTVIRAEGGDFGRHLCRSIVRRWEPQIRRLSSRRPHCVFLRLPQAPQEICEQHTSHVTFSRAMTRTCVAQVVSLACAHHIPCVISMRSCCVFDSLRLLHFPLSAHHLLSYHPVLPPGHQLHLPRCGGQIPCALQLMRTLALLPSTTLSQVMSPTTTTSRRLLNRYHRHCALFTTVHPGARRWCQPSTSSSQSSSVGHRTGRLVGGQFDSRISNVRENPRHSSESEQIRILLERKKEQILADCQAEIRKHEFHTDYDRRIIQKLNETIESQQEELHRAQAEERRRRDHQLLHEQLLKQNWDLREAH